MSDSKSTAATSPPVGAATMSPAMAGMRHYPRYLLAQVLPHLGRRVWEIGVGHGQYTSLLRQAGKVVLATDIDAECVRLAAEQFRDDPAVTTARVDLTIPATVHAQRSFQADSVICFNVLEHLEDHIAALQSLGEAVTPGATLGIIVPAHPALYGRMDEEAGHFRRYTRDSLRKALQAGNWQVRQVRYLNLAGAAGWWYHNRLRTSAGLADETVNRQMRSADRWLPIIARSTDWCCGFIVGLSVVAIATAPASPSSTSR